MEMPRDKEAWRAAYRARVEAMEQVRFEELKGMTEERAREIMGLLEVAETPWRERRDWSGLVEQQRVFSRGRKR